MVDEIVFCNHKIKAGTLIGLNPPTVVIRKLPKRSDINYNK